MCHLERIILLAVVVFPLPAVVAVLPLDVIVILVSVRLGSGGGHHVEAGQWLKALPVGAGGCGLSAHAGPRRGSPRQLRRHRLPEAPRGARLVPAEAGILAVGAPGHQVAARRCGARPQVVEVVPHRVALPIVGAPELVVDPLLLRIRCSLLPGIEPE